MSSNKEHTCICGRSFLRACELGKHKSRCKQVKASIPAKPAPDVAELLIVPPERKPAPAEAPEPEAVAVAVADDADDVDDADDMDDVADDAPREDCLSYGVPEMDEDDSDDVPAEPRRRAASPAPVAEIEDRLEAKRFARDKIKSAESNGAHPQSLRASKERIEKVHICYTLAQKAGHGLTEDELFALGDSELDAYTKKFQGEFDARMTEAVMKSGTLTDAYIQFVSLATIGAGRLVKRDASAVQNALRENRETIDVAVKDVLEENREMLRYMSPMNRLLLVTLMPVCGALATAPPLDTKKKSPESSI